MYAEVNGLIVGSSLFLLIIHPNFPTNVELVCYGLIELLKFFIASNIITYYASSVVFIFGHSEYNKFIAKRAKTSQKTKLLIWLQSTFIYLSFVMELTFYRR